MQSFLNTTNKYETSKATSSCNKNAPSPPKKSYGNIVIMIANKSDSASALNSSETLI